MTRMIPSLKKWVRVVAGWVLLAALCAAPAAAQELVIRFFTVGQGDGALVTSPEGKTALIDGGLCDGIVSLDLTDLQIDSLDLVVASPNHADHIGGFWDIIRTTKVSAYMENGVPASTETYENLLVMLRARHVPVLEATERTLQLGSVSLRVLPMPPGDHSQNNSSVGVLVTYQGFTALFTGDAEAKERREWEADGSLPHVSVLKVAHHGAANGTDSMWLKSVQPLVAVISVGAHNKYEHPSPTTLDALAAIGATVYRTDREGDITVTVDSVGGFAVRTDSTPLPRQWSASVATHH
jgi:competence protein ComEC